MKWSKEVVSWKMASRCCRDRSCSARVSNGKTPLCVYVSPGATRSKEFGSSSSKGDRRSVLRSPFCWRGIRVCVIMEEAVDVVMKEARDSAELSAWEYDRGVVLFECDRIECRGLSEDRWLRRLGFAFPVELTVDQS